MKEIAIGFRSFIMRGNIIDLAVAFVIGLAFANVVESLVANIITPLIAAIFGEPSFAGLHFEINGAIFGYGAFLDSIISFVSIAAAIYFLIVLPMEKINERRMAGQPVPDATTKLCPECLSEIPLAARRCSHCAQPVA